MGFARFSALYLGVVAALPFAPQMTHAMDIREAMGRQLLEVYSNAQYDAVVMKASNPKMTEAQMSEVLNRGVARQYEEFGLVRLAFDLAQRAAKSQRPNWDVQNNPPSDVEEKQFVEQWRKKWMLVADRIQREQTLTWQDAADFQEATYLAGLVGSPLRAAYQPLMNTFSKKLRREQEALVRPEQKPRPQKAQIARPASKTKASGRI